MLSLGELITNLLNDTWAKFFIKRSATLSLAKIGAYDRLFARVSRV